MNVIKVYGLKPHEVTKLNELAKKAQTTRSKVIARHLRETLIKEKA